MNQDSFSFIVYIIHACADKWDMLPSEVYRKMQSVQCINKYLLPHYEILHTQGTGFVVEDVKEYLEIRGVALSSALPPLKGEGDRAKHGGGVLTARMKRF